MRSYYLMVFEALTCRKKDHTTCKAIKTGLENYFFSRVPFWLRSHFERCGPILNWNPFCRSKVDFECLYCIHSRRIRKVNAIYFFLRLVRSLESRHSQHYATRKFADCNVRDSLTLLFGYGGSRDVKKLYFDTQIILTYAILQIHRPARRAVLLTT